MEENKFNFSEEDDQNKIVEESKEAVVKDAKGLVNNSKQFLYGIFSFRNDISQQAFCSFKNYPECTDL